MHNHPCFVAVMLLVAVLSPAQAQSTANIELHNDLTHLDINITPVPGPSGGCASGQRWDVDYGRCIAPRVLRNQSTSQSRTVSCPSPQTGTMTQRRTGSYPVYGWKLPPSGTQSVSHNGSTSWSGWSTTSSNCQNPPPPSEPPPPSPPLPLQRQGTKSWNALVVFRQLSGLRCPAHARPGTLVHAKKHTLMFT